MDKPRIFEGSPGLIGSGHMVHCEHACHCSCHNSGAMHVMACCSVCPVCHGYVVFLEAHLNKCHSDVSFPEIHPF